ncbi:unnamed protein product [Didymodactylos carnosus]|uniref:Uncharacterized protein n=1 Tax=Didymodactylos carnosus TaxID=1234261 RepID=A0A814LYY9_9BILA|nr:unnamed protein product [Didymodactylos carnosus]CAF1071562.1 unnamed protein product [Didymodactylos carnosus]CAF3714442.1 unnamed protein product [Didymodactylos carnosus]CAF3838597.1 unnamed protein product [Didymodactylos carnosus]
MMRTNLRRMENIVFARLTGNGNFNKHAQRGDSSSISSSPLFAGSWPLFASQSVANLDNDGDTNEMNVTKIAPRTYSLYNCINSKARGGTDRDVPLHHLLMPAETAAAQYRDDHKDISPLTFKQFDPRLFKSLSLSEFLLAFVKFF